MHSESNAPKPYFGPERRTGQDRRRTAERREEHRFEPGKDLRRSGADRRSHEGRDGPLPRQEPGR